jgi:hypothetical protein
MINLQEGEFMNLIGFIVASLLGSLSCIIGIFIGKSFYQKPEKNDWGVFSPIFKKVDPIEEKKVTAEEEKSNAFYE